MQKRREEEKGDTSQGVWFLEGTKEQEGRNRARGVLTHSLSLSSTVCQLWPSSSSSPAGLPSGFWLSLLLSPS